jgi:hypothetical protein
MTAEEGCAGEFVEVNVDGVSGIQGVVVRYIDSNMWLNDLLTYTGD